MPLVRPHARTNAQARSVSAATLSESRCASGRVPCPRMAVTNAADNDQRTAEGRFVRAEQLDLRLGEFDASLLRERDGVRQQLPAVVLCQHHPPEAVQQDSGEDVGGDQPMRAGDQRRQLAVLAVVTGVREA